MDIQLDQMDSRNAKKVAESKANKKLKGFMGKVNGTDGIYGDKKKNGNGGPKLVKGKNDVQYTNDNGDKYLIGGDYKTGDGRMFVGENTSPVNKGLKPYVTILESSTDFKEGEKINLKDIFNR